MNWSAETLWAVLGVAVSAGFGIWGVYLTLRQKYPGRITFVRENVIELFDDIGKSLPGLSVTYNGEQVSNNLVLINAALVNTGGIDITPTMVETPISIALPKDYQWLTARITDSSRNLHTSVKIADNGTITFETGLIKRREFVRFHALASVPIEERKEGESPKRLLSQNLAFFHRISNTAKIEQTEFDGLTPKRLRRLMIPLALMMALGIAVMSWLILRDAPEQLGFQYASSTGAAPIAVSATLKNGKVRVRSDEHSLDTDIELKDFWGRVTGVAPVKQDTSFLAWLVAVAYVGLPVLLMLLIYFLNRWNQRLRRILGPTT